MNTEYRYSSISGEIFSATLYQSLTQGGGEKKILSKLVSRTLHHHIYTTVGFKTDCDICLGLEDLLDHGHLLDELSLSRLHLLLGEVVALTSGKREVRTSKHQSIHPF